MSGRLDDLEITTTARGNKSQNDLETEKIIALLDIDATLVSSKNAAFLNKALLEALREQGIVDLYLFSTMYRSNLKHDLDALDRNEQAYTRPNLIKELQRQGFNVHRVCIPADLVTKDKDHKSQLPAEEGIPSIGHIATGKFGGMYDQYAQEYARLTTEKPYELDAKAQTFVKDLDHDDQIAGFMGIAAGYTLNRNDPDRSYDTKGLMYEEFLRNIPEVESEIRAKVGGIVYFDDARSCVNAVGRANALVAATRDNTLTTSNLVKADAVEATQTRLADLPAVPLKIVHVDAFTPGEQSAAKKYDDQARENKTFLQPLQEFTQSKPKLEASLEEGKRHLQHSKKESKRDERTFLLSSLLEQIKSLPDDYATLGRSTHQNDIKQLVAEVNKIATLENLEQYSPEELKTKTQLVVKEIEKAFHKEENNFRKPFFRAFGAEKKPAQLFITKLSESDPKDTHNPDASYQFPKLLATTLQIAYQNDPRLMNVSGKLDAAPLINNIKLGTHQIYSRKVNALLGNPALINPVRDHINNLAKLSSNRLSAAFVYNLYQGHEEFNPKNVKDVLKVWPKLKTSLKFSDKEIQLFLDKNGALEPGSALAKKIQRLGPAVTGQVLYTLRQALENTSQIRKEIKALQDLKASTLEKRDDVRHKV